MQNNVTKSEIEQARRMDVLTYLKQYEPGELVKVSSGIYCTRTHDSLKISNGKWYWWSRNIGGRSALDYLVAAKGMGLVQAVRYINGLGGSICLPAEGANTTRMRSYDTAVKQLLLPTANENNDRVTQYLKARCIDSGLLDYCFQNRLIYEDKARHNCVFVGYDSQGQPRHATLRSSSLDSTFCRDAVGSDKAHTFRLLLGDKTDDLYLFESAIDLLSYFTMYKMKHQRLPKLNAISLSGVYVASRNATDLPITLQYYLAENQSVEKIILCFDNDNPGRKTANQLAKILSGKYKVDIRLPAHHKDYNDMLRVACNSGHNIATRSNERKKQTLR